MSKLIFLELTTDTQGLAYAPDSTIPGAYVSALVVLVLIFLLLSFSGMIQNPILPWFMTFYVISFCDILCHMPYHDGDMGIKSYTTLKEKNHHRLEKIFQKAK